MRQKGSSVQYLISRVDEEVQELELPLCERDGAAIDTHFDFVESRTDMGAAKLPFSKSLRTDGLRLIMVLRRATTSRGSAGLVI
jgi:hypothetical protein